MKDTQKKQNTASRIDLKMAADHVSEKPESERDKKKRETRWLTFSAILAAALWDCCMSDR